MPVLECPTCKAAGGTDGMRWLHLATPSDGLGGHAAADGAPRLTRRQKEILLHCVARGYYEIPRRSTLRSLAAELGISPTTLSLVLRRAERAVVERFASERLPA